jgi:cyclic pyranopterin phosphate synthase
MISGLQYPHAMTGVTDTMGRPVRDLRISVTDRCNFRCTYCMPKEIFGKDYEFLARDQLLSFEEITRVASVFASEGVTKIRLTGGEPLLRRGIEDLIGMLAGVDGIDDLTLTTNGSLLERKAEALAAAGLNRVTVSLDSMDDTVFMAMNDVGYPVDAVLAGIQAATAAGLTPVKVNMVVKRGVNEDSIVEVAEHFRGTGHIVRFIEFMDVGTTNGWNMGSVVPSAEVVERINEKFPLEPADPNYRGEVANRWRYVDGEGEIGVISSVTQPFCSDCTRVRLSAEGRLYTCLFAVAGTDLRAAIRNGADDAELHSIITDVWSGRTDRYSEIRSKATKRRPKIEMSYIGG